eukprot:TRINITY_DN7637_c0_g1_i2.p1 TRINITY_DN7637_c0_g1~~TRINITY_DN7637_c0_g1_i2.p1  ORF type:complete len:563 (-),score=62.63 TRINITY_DN7637_c0_g1_i2:374-2062(-)
MRTEELVVRCSMGILLFLFVTFGLRALWKSVDLRSVGNFVAMCFSNCRGCHLDEKHMLASALAETRAHERARKVIVTYAVMACPMMFQYARGGVRALLGEDGRDQATHVVHMAPALSLIPVFSMALLCLICSSRLTVKLVPLLHVSIFACLIHSIQNTEGIQETVWMYPQILVWRLLVSFIPVRAGSNIIVNIILSCFQIVELASLFDETFVATQQSFDFPMLVFLVILSFGIPTTIGLLLDAMTFREALATIEISISDKWQQAFSDLQDASCSVVVKLDQHLRITPDSASKFEAFLLKSKGSVSDSKLSEFASENDSEILETFLTSGTKCSKKTDIFRSLPCCVSFLDSTGNKVPVQVYHTQFEDLHQRQQHVVGIVETETRSPLAELEESDVEVSREALWRSHSMPSKSKELKGTPASPQPEREDELRTMLPPLTNPSFQQTSEGIKIWSLIQLVRMWNLQLERRSCCVLHSHLRECEAILKTARKNMSCQDQESFIQDMAGHQCSHCGMVVSPESLGIGDSGQCAWCLKLSDPSPLWIAPWNVRSKIRLKTPQSTRVEL